MTIEAVPERLAGGLRAYAARAGALDDGASLVELCA